MHQHDKQRQQLFHLQGEIGSQPWEKTWGNGWSGVFLWENGENTSEILKHFNSQNPKFVNEIERHVL